MSVGLVVVSHSRELAAGTAALARQMAPAVTIAQAGGTDDGEIGTSFDAIVAALAEADTGDGAVLLYDLRSALLTAETALEFMADPSRVRIVDAPLVEGALAAAVAAQGGGDLEAVAGAAGGAGAAFAGNEPPPVAQPPAEGPTAARAVVVINRLGLHARPVATLVRALEGRAASVTVGRPDGPRVDLRTVLRVVGLAIRGGETVELTATGPDAEATADALAGIVAGGFGEADPNGRLSPVAMGAAPARLGTIPSGRTLQAAPHPQLLAGLLTAVSGSPGLAVGPLVKLDRAPVRLDAKREKPTDPAAEQRELELALGAAQRRLAAGNQFEAAHAVLLSDPDLADDATRRIGDGDDAATAWWHSVVQRAEIMAADADELVAARAVDVREAGAAVLAELGVEVDRIPKRLGGGIVVTEDVGPGEIPVLVERGAAGVVLSRSSVTAHAVIVARGLGLPMVLQAGDEPARLANGTLLVLDGDAGTIRVDPPPDEVQDVRRRVAQLAQDRKRLIDEASAPVVLADGRQVHVVANIGSVADARAAVASGADGVGLLRTELLVLDRDTYPDEETQVADLTAVLQVLGERPVVIRVLDAGGDKPVTALNLDVLHNGFLGVRGLRYLLAHPDLLRTQLRAVFRAAVGHRVSVMAPMVAVAAEVAAFRQAVDDALASLRESGHEHRPPEKVGVMIEVPAAAVAADEICALADFVSVGSNDLTSYLMAADRTVPEVAGLLDPASTALQRMLDQLCRYAAEAGTPVAVCGEIAGLADQVPGLVARGVLELSVAPARIPMIKQTLRNLPG